MKVNHEYSFRGSYKKKTIFFIHKLRNIFSKNYLKRFAEKDKRNSTVCSRVLCSSFEIVHVLYETV